MRKKAMILGLLCLALLLIGILGCFWVLNYPYGTQIEIVQNGKVLQRFDLMQTENQIIEVEYEGRINQIEIQDGKIRMLAANCPDNTCVRMGWLDLAVPIVCLPNHLVIQFVEETEEVDTFIRQVLK